MFLDLDYFIFGIMPYIALTVLIVGSIARYERDPFTWKSSSSQLLRRKQLMWVDPIPCRHHRRVLRSPRRTVHAGA